MRTATPGEGLVSFLVRASIFAQPPRRPTRPEHRQSRFFNAGMGTIRETLAAFEDLRDATCPDDREFGGSVLSNPLDPTQKTARSGRMDIDIIGATISQSTT